jgi:hypothetical protein
MASGLDHWHAVVTLGIRCHPVDDGSRNADELHLAYVGAYGAEPRSAPEFALCPFQLSRGDHFKRRLQGVAESDRRNTWRKGYRRAFESNAVCPGFAGACSTDRASAFEAGGCRFEPCRAHHAWQTAGNVPAYRGGVRELASFSAVLCAPPSPSERRVSSFRMRRAMLPGRCSSGTWAQEGRRPSEIPPISPSRGRCGSAHPRQRAREHTGCVDNDHRSEERKMLQSNVHHRQGHMPEAQ